MTLNSEEARNLGVKLAQQLAGLDETVEKALVLEFEIPPPQSTGYVVEDAERMDQYAGDMRFAAETIGGLRVYWAGPLNDEGRCILVGCRGSLLAFVNDQIIGGGKHKQLSEAKLADTTQDALGHDLSGAVTEGHRPGCIYGQSYANAHGLR
ncbi:MAG: hypothetical protein HGA90_03455 [Alphaproteobacteria bacterium]|nr:hypothetical protein [Alphaproteobacteria bacterium]